MISMPESPLPLAQQLALCQQLARAVRSQLPIADETSIDRVQQQLAAGKSLEETLAGDASPASRSLAACIHIGQQSGRLADALEAWTETQLAKLSYHRALRGALVYPLLLIAVALLSLGYVFWQLIPEYRVTYALVAGDLPVWLQWLDMLRKHVAWLMGGLLLLAYAPLLVWWWYARSSRRDGVPRDRTGRLRGQALAARLLHIGIEGGVPLTQLATSSVQATGATPAAASAAFGYLQQQMRIPQLSREASMLLAALHAGLLPAAEATRHLELVAETLGQQADDQAARAVRWVPTLVALSIGGLTLLTYVLLIYGPWILLLRRIIQTQ